MTLTQGEFLFHYISSDGVVALAIAGVCSFLLALTEVLYVMMGHLWILGVLTEYSFLSDPDSGYDRGEAFRFLTSVLDKFLRQFGERVHSAIAFAMNTEFSPVIAR